MYFFHKDNPLMVLYILFIFWFKNFCICAASDDMLTVRILLQKLEDDSKCCEHELFLENIKEGLPQTHTNRAYYNAWFNLHVFLGYFDMIIHVFTNYIKTCSEDSTIDVSPLFYCDCSLLLDLTHCYTLEAPRKRDNEGFEYIKQIINTYDILLTNHQQTLKKMPNLRVFLRNISKLIEALKRVVYMPVLNIEADLQKKIIMTLSLTMFYKAIEENFTLSRTNSAVNNESDVVVDLDENREASVESYTYEDLNERVCVKTNSLEYIMHTINETYLFIRKYESEFLEASTNLKKIIDYNLILSTVNEYYKLIRSRRSVISAKEYMLIYLLNNIQLNYQLDDIRKLKTYYTMNISKKIMNYEEWNAVVEAWVEIND
ncbi:hypothetical protein THOM_2412 [Trachipleistophora hominis]|uniref:Uncharacterized protein n=1 Tax=Trachipleistophora hominis TaxID=72359 RepID=L7JUG8_TRAHO|nr:hypothetical protein THOM_2412 [Trachipleistophora hominis]